MIRVLIVDDSVVMRHALSRMLSHDPEIEIAGVARDGVEAVEKVAALKPDIVTMDIEMPRMNGIEALREIMDKNPVPVLMVSSLTTENAKITLEALEIGAVDFIPKNLSDFEISIVNIKEILLEKIKKIGKKGLAVMKKGIPDPLSMPSRGARPGVKISIVAIGASTGGPRALQSIISQIPKNFPVPILIAQHMPKSFTGPFAERLNNLSQIQVKEAENDENIRNGTAYIAPGGAHMSIARNNASGTQIVITDNNKYLYKPSVDNLMLSIAKTFSGDVLGVILTGLGNDGTKGMEEIKENGGKIIAQNEESCVVYGMPRSVIESGIADKVIPVEEIAGEIVHSV